MTNITYILLGWLGFITVVYLYMWFDSKEHHFNIVEKLTSIKETFTEDE